jgi:hypothetical protein
MKLKALGLIKKDIIDIPLKKQACLDKGYLFVYDCKGNIVTI